jgi:hypothetical protein
MTQTQTQPMTQTKSLFQSIREVLPESQIAAIIDLREITSSIQWQAGDLVNSIYMQVIANKVEASIMDVCFFVSDEIYGLFAPQTLRIYSAVAKFYPTPTRNDMLPFWLYRYATRLENDWQKAFKWVDLFMDTHARLPYEREVRAYFEPDSIQVNQPVTENYLSPIPPEVQAVEKATLTHSGKLSLRYLVSGLLDFIPSMLGEFKDPQASQLLAQIGALSRQFLEQYL